MITYICVRAHVHIDSSKKDKKGYIFQSNKIL